MSNCFSIKTNTKKDKEKEKEKQKLVINKQIEKSSQVIINNNLKNNFYSLKFQKSWSCSVLYFKTDEKMKCLFIIYLLEKVFRITGSLHDQL